jgi:hypothetical protein
MGYRAKSVVLEIKPTFLCGVYSLCVAFGIWMGNDCMGTTL